MEQNLSDEIEKIKEKRIFQQDIIPGAVKRRHIEEGLLLPPGAIVSFAGSSAPVGYLLCDGSTISRKTYADLFDAIGTTYGSGDGLNTFTLPNMKGRIPVGYDVSQTEFDVLGETGGEKTHTISAAEMPTHNHSVVVQYRLATSPNPAYNGDGITGSSGATALSAYTAIPTITSGNAGSGTAANVLQPYIALNYIIKV